MITRGSLPRVEIRKEKKGVRRRGTETGIGKEIGIEEGARTWIGKKTEIGKETETEIGKGIETETVIGIIEIASGIVVIEGNGEEVEMMTRIIITVAGTTIGNVNMMVYD